MRLSVVALPKPNRLGELPFYLRLSRAGTKRHVALGFRVHRDDWSAREGEARCSAPEAVHVNQILADRRAAPAVPAPPRREPGPGYGAGSGPGADSGLVSPEDAERDGDPSHAVQAALGALRAEAERLVRRRYREGRPDLIRGDLARLARRAGLAARLQGALTRGLQAVDRGVRRELEAQFVRANTPGPLPVAGPGAVQDALDAARASAPVQAAYSGALRRGLSDLARSDRAIEREVVPLVEEAVREGKGVRHVAGLLEERIGAKAHAAKVAVATARAAYDRAARVELAHGAGERLGVPVRYRYTGPPPERAFCRTHLGRVYTRAEIAALPSEQGLPPLYYGGGYGCRHRWVIVIGEPEAEGPPPVEVTPAWEAELARREAAGHREEAAQMLRERASAERAAQTGLRVRLDFGEKNLRGGPVDVYLEDRKAEIKEMARVAGRSPFEDRIKVGRKKPQQEVYLFDVRGEMDPGALERGRADLSAWAGRRAGRKAYILFPTDPPTREDFL